MAVTGRSPWLALLASTAILGAQPAPIANRELLVPVNRIAAGLSNNTAGDALAPIDPSCPDREKLRGAFAALTDGYLISNEVDPMEEQTVGTDEARLTVRWAMTLTSQASGDSIHRSETIHLRLVHRKNSWLIKDLQPSSFFDPQVSANGR